VAGLGTTPGEGVPGDARTDSVPVDAPGGGVEVPDVVAEVFGTRTPQAVAYSRILQTTGIEWGLVGPSEAGRIWSRHLLNCAALAGDGLIPVGARVVDVGSGAGLPGIPLAIARPDLRVRLLEPLLRRFTFLERTVAELDLGDHVDVLRGRAEDHRETYDAVVCRAVAPLSRLVGWCAPLLGPGGQLLALKGESAGDEVQAASGVLKRLGLRAKVRTVACPGADPATLVQVWGV